jgi:hypothetical protein
MEVVIFPIAEPPKPPLSNVRGNSVRDRKTQSTGPPSSPIEVAPITPPVDWEREAEFAARAYSLAPSGEPPCVDIDRLGLSKPKCKKRTRSFQWNPEIPRAGVEGGVPFIRLGPCVVALGAFGCAVGKEKANGHLFDDLKDPDRPRSSVPDANE